MNRKFKNLAVASSLLFIGAMTVPVYNAEQVPANNTGISLDENGYFDTQLDDVADISDVDMFSIQNAEDIIINPTENFSVELIGEGWSEDTPNSSKLTYDTFTGNEGVIYHNSASYYNPATGEVEQLDMKLDITDYKKGPETLTGKNYLTIFTSGINAERLRIDQSTNDVSFNLYFINSSGEVVKNRDVEMLWTDMDATSSVSYESDAIQQIIAPTYDRSKTNEFDNPYFYMNLESMMTSEYLNTSIIDYVNYQNIDFSDYRIGIYDDGNMATIYDRWTNGVTLTDEANENITDEMNEAINSIPHVSRGVGSTAIQNAPGQNFGIIVNTGNSGIVKLDFGNQYSLTNRRNGNTLYLASPDMANTSITKTIMDSNGDGVAENGEKLMYTVTISNNSDKLNAYLTEFKDSMIISVPEGLSFNNDVTLDEGIETIGDVNSGQFRIVEIPAGEYTTISYSFNVDDINAYLLTEGGVIDNIATDNGAAPLVCDELDNGIDCGEAIINPNGYTEISKTALDDNEDGIFQVGESLTYDIHLENNSGYDAYNVLVRDSIFETKIPSYLEISNTEISTSGFNIETTGALQTGDLTLNTVPSSESVDIIYSLKLLEQPDDEIISITNIVTDNGEKPDVCDKVDKDLECGETITPIEPKPDINKSVYDENGDGILQGNEVLTYEINIINESNLPTTNITIRDSLLENLPDYVDFNNNPTVEGSKFDVETTGDLSKGDFSINEIPGKSSVKIIYELKVNDIPENVESILNIVTDNGENPEVCEDEDKGKDCDEAIIPTEPNTVINKLVVDDNKDGIVQDNEVLTYKINVANESKITAKNVIVRDSLLENLPEYVTIEEEPIATGSKFDVKTTGDLTSGDFSIVEIPAKSNVVITYSLKVDEVPEDIESILNIVTDNGEDPLVCKDEDKGKDCDEAVIPTHAETLIEKSVTDENEDGVVQEGEVLNYQITVTNPTGNEIKNVNVRDSLLENLPEYLTYNEDFKINPTDVKSQGDLSKGDFTLETVEANSDVEISYSLTANEVPKKISEIVNIVTDNGEDPTICEEENEGIDCDTATIPKEKIKLITVKEEEKEEEETPSMPHTGM